MEGIISLWAASLGALLLAPTLVIHKELRLSGHLSMQVHNLGAIVLFIALSLLLLSLPFGFVAWKTWRGRLGAAITLLMLGLLAYVRLAWHVLF